MGVKTDNSLVNSAVEEIGQYGSVLFDGHTGHCDLH